MNHDLSRIGIVFALMVWSSVSPLSAGSVELVSDVRQVDLSVPVDTGEIDTNPAEFGSAYDVSLSDVEVREGLNAFDEIESFETSRFVSQKSVIEYFPNGAVTIDAELGARNQSFNSDPFLISAMDRSRSVLELTFEFSEAYNYDITFSLDATGDESPGASIEIFGNGPYVSHGFLGGPFNLPFELFGDQRDSPFSFSETIGPGQHSLLATADAAHDGDDSLGSANVSFFLRATPVPEPSSRQQLIGLLLLLPWLGRRKS